MVPSNGTIIQYHSASTSFGTQNIIQHHHTVRSYGTTKSNSMHRFIFQCSYFHFINRYIVYNTNDLKVFTHYLLMVISYGTITFIAKLLFAMQCLLIQIYVIKLYHICHIHVSLKLRKYLIHQMQFKGISNQIIIALIINLKILNDMVVLRQRLKRLCSISMQNMSHLQGKPVKFLLK